MRLRRSSREPRLQHKEHRPREEQQAMQVDHRGAVESPAGGG